MCKNNQIDICLYIFSILIYFVRAIDNIERYKTLNKSSAIDLNITDFEEYLKKFDASNVWEKIDKDRKYNDRNITNDEQFDIMFKGIDPIDELMSLSLELGVGDQTESRRYGWQPPKGPDTDAHGLDPFHLRHRIFDLMRQALYQTRNKMIIMQIYRRKFGDSPLYKMGFLTSKVDHACKVFAMFTYRAWRGCLMSKEAIIMRLPVSQLLETHQKQLYMWFNIELMTDLILRNDAIARNILKNQTYSRRETFKAKYID